MKINYLDLIKSIEKELELLEAPEIKPSIKNIINTIKKNIKDEKISAN